MSVNLEDRRRETEPNHVRTMEVQSLDALIRIEETLTSILEGMRHIAKQLLKTPETAPEEDLGRSIANTAKSRARK